jgi:hypothetical protein
MTGNSVGEPEGTNWQYRYFLKVIDGGGFGCRNLEDLAFQLKITGTPGPPDHQGCSEPCWRVTSSPPGDSRDTINHG